MSSAETLVQQEIRVTVTSPLRTLYWALTGNSGLKMYHLTSTNPCERIDNCCGNIYCKNLHFIQKLDETYLEVEGRLELHQCMFVLRDHMRWRFVRRDVRPVKICY